jgi:uncharacterized membrane-anchored protein YitT (DUF2179 family)
MLAKFKKGGIMELIEKNSGFKKEIIRVAILTFAALLYAFNINSFVNTGGLYPGGFAGVTILIQRVADIFFNISIPYTLLYVPINLIPVYIGFKYIGKMFTIYSLYVIVAISLLVDLLPLITITYDIVLIAVFGGILNGISIGICLIVGASGGGSDFISIYYSEKKGIDVWNYIFFANAIILIIAGIIFGFDKAMYSILFQYATTQLIQTLYKRQQKQTFLVITEKPKEVYEKIRELTHHDATLFKGEGLFEGKERNLVYSVISAEESDKVNKGITEVDPKAFTNILETKYLGGRFYRKPKE